MPNVVFIARHVSASISVISQYLQRTDCVMIAIISLIPYTVRPYMRRHLSGYY